MLVVLQEVVHRTVGVNYTLAFTIWLLAVLAGGLSGYWYGVRVDG